MDTSYSPVDYVHREVIQEAIELGRKGKIFFFRAEGEVDSVEGRIAALKEIPGKGEFIVMDPFFDVRIDRIITVFGKPSAAYDEYDNYANQCLSCMGGNDHL